MTTEPAANCLYVSRLTRNVNNDHLSEIFGSYGNVVRVEVSVDRRNGLSKGTAVVQFANPKDAENALIYLNGGQIDGNVIEVSDKVSNQSTERGRGVTTGRQVVQHDGKVEGKKGKGNNQIPADNLKATDVKVDLGKRSRSSRSRSRNGQRGVGASSVPMDDGRAAKKYVPKDRTQEVAVKQARLSRSRDRGNNAVPVAGSRVATRDLERGARVDSRERNRGNTGRDVAGGAGRGGGPGRRADSRDRGLSRYGPASGPAPVDRRGGNSRDAGAGIYGPSGGSGPPPRGAAGGRGRPGEARYVPVDRTRGRSRSRSPVRGGVRRAGDVRRDGRSRSPPARGGRSPPRRRSVSYSRSRSRSRSSESGYRRRARRSYSSSSSSRSGSFRRSRSYSRSTRSSRSPSRSRSVSRSRSYSRSPSRSRSVSASRSRSRSPAHSARSRSASK